MSGNAAMILPLLDQSTSESRTPSLCSHRRHDVLVFAHMIGYEHLPGFEHLYLEDSWVLGIRESADELRFEVEAALTQDHPEWHPPEADAVHTYKRLVVVFRKPRQVTWVQRMAGPPAVDASGEIDYGHIDVFTWDESLFDLAGDWGHVRVVAERPVVLDS
jgi:hypothetical protein